MGSQFLLPWIGVSNLTLNFWVRFHEKLGSRLDLSTAFHSQIDGQSERMIYVLEYTLHVCMMNFGGHYDQYLPLVEFSYNNYHLSIYMVSFKTLYGMKCRSSIRQFDAFKMSLYGINLLKNSLDKVNFIQKNLLASQSRKKEYAD